VAVGVLLVDQEDPLPLQLLPYHVGLLELALLAGLVSLVYHPDYLVLLQTVLFAGDGV
jgi:hypothetical protein